MENVKSSLSSRENEFITQMKEAEERFKIQIESSEKQHAIDLEKAKKENDIISSLRGLQAAMARRIETLEVTKSFFVFFVWFLKQNINIERLISMDLTN